MTPLTYTEFLSLKPGDKVVYTNISNTAQSIGYYPNINSILTVEYMEGTFLFLKEIKRNSSRALSGYAMNRFSLYKRRLPKNYKGEIHGRND